LFRPAAALGIVIEHLGRAAFMDALEVGNRGNHGHDVHFLTELVCIFYQFSNVHASCKKRASGGSIERHRKLRRLCRVRAVRERFDKGKHVSDAIAGTDTLHNRRAHNSAIRNRRYIGRGLWCFDPEAYNHRQIRL